MSALSKNGRSLFSRFGLVVLAWSIVGYGAEAYGAISDGQGMQPTLEKAIEKIHAEGFNNSSVIDIASELTDRFGARLTASPAINAAHEWTRQQFATWGLRSTRLESWPFGRGWSCDYAVVRMVRPSSTQLFAVPRAWSAGTTGPITAPVVAINLFDENDISRYRGKLAGRIVLTGSLQAPPPPPPGPRRWSDAELREFQSGTSHRPSEPDWRELFLRSQAQRRKIIDIVKTEKIAAIIEMGRGDLGALAVPFVQMGFLPEYFVSVPTLVMPPEHLGRILRLLKKGDDVELEVNVQVTFHDKDTNGYNTVAEIPGTDKRDEVVMVGAHLDSSAGAYGATDNAAGVSVVMEAMRILASAGLKPRRTIRVALWGGEENGLLGSTAYVRRHFAEGFEADDDIERTLPPLVRRVVAPTRVKPGHEKVSAYFNVDEGTGKVRGVYLMQNGPARSMMERWISPLKELGVVATSLDVNSNSDAWTFYLVGIPAFEFIQDEIERPRTEHTTADVFERLIPEDLKQAAVAVATILYQAAMEEPSVPRMPASPDR